jgi:hypothetical protein
VRETSERKLGYGYYWVSMGSLGLGETCVWKGFFGKDGGRRARKEESTGSSIKLVHVRVRVYVREGWKREMITVGNYLFGRRSGFELQYYYHGE